MPLRPFARPALLAALASLVLLPPALAAQEARALRVGVTHAPAPRAVASDTTDVTPPRASHVIVSALIGGVIGGVVGGLLPVSNADPTPPVFASDVCCFSQPRHDRGTNIVLSAMVGAVVGAAIGFAF